MNAYQQCFLGLLIITANYATHPNGRDPDKPLWPLLAHITATLACIAVGIWLVWDALGELAQ